MGNKQLEQVINDFCLLTSGEGCTINITSRTKLDIGRDSSAELVRFEFGEYQDTCIAILYNDGTLFLPLDWATPTWNCDDFAIDDIDWLCSDGRRAINLNGMPRLLF